MPDISKYDQILDALQSLMENQKLQAITVSEIAQTAGIGKGSIYYYFSSKEAILQALIERNYKKPLETAKDLAQRTAEILRPNICAMIRPLLPSAHRNRPICTRSMSVI